MWVSEIKEDELTDELIDKLLYEGNCSQGHIVIYPCRVDATNTKRDNWMESEAGRKRATAEAINVIRCVNNGVFPDFEI